MTRTLQIQIAALLVLLLAACGGDNTQSQSQQEPQADMGQGGGKEDDPWADASGEDGQDAAPGDVDLGDPVDAGDFGDQDGDSEPDAPEGDMGQEVARVPFGQCRQGQPPSLEAEGFEHFGSDLLVAAADPGHSAHDVLITDDHTAVLEGKFAYGFLSKDLEDELVEVWMDDCAGGYTLLGESVTDSDGRIYFPLSPEELPAHGAYQIWMRVVGDSSSVSLTLRVVPPQTPVIVFDIDATLTVDDLELFADLGVDLFEPIFHGEYVPEHRAGSREITALRHAQGYQVVYLTGRPYLLTDRSRQWLEDVGAAPGSLRLTDSNLEILPTESGVGEFKATYLEHLRDVGLDLSGAYGNATTDIYAYGRAGLPLERTWILGAHGGEEGTQALGDDYLEHLPQAEAEPTPQGALER